MSCTGASHCVRRISLTTRTTLPTERPQQHQSGLKIGFCSATSISEGPLVKGKLPRWHADAVKPHFEAGVGQVAVQPPNKGLVVTPCEGEEYGAHRCCL